MTSGGTVPRWVAVLLFLVPWGLTTHGKYSATGDEPHYLMVAQGLWADHDLDVRNNYANADGILFGAATLQPELHARPAKDGLFLPVHDIGVPVLLLPVYGAATSFAKLAPLPVLRRFRMDRGLFAYALISLFIIGLVTQAGVLTASALLQAGVARKLALTVVVAAWLTAPVLSNGFLVFPEPFALLITSWVLVFWAGSLTTAGRCQQTALIFALGALPWVHRKYEAYAIALLGLVLWKRYGERLMQRQRLFMDLVVFATPQIGLAVWTFRYWGNLAGPLALDGLPLSFAVLKVGLVGMFLDREGGLLWWAPSYALLPAAWWVCRRERWICLVPVLAVIIPSAAHDQWWGGFSPAGRFLVPLVPIFCYVGACLYGHRRTLPLCGALLMAQAAIAIYGWQHPRFLWQQGDGHNPILGSALEALGIGEGWIPSLRIPAASATTILAVLVAVVVINVLAVWAWSIPVDARSR